MAGLGFVRNNPWVQQDRLRKTDLPVLQHSLVPNGTHSDTPVEIPRSLDYQSDVARTKTVVRLRDSPPPPEPFKSLQEHRTVLDEPYTGGKERTVIPSKYVNSVSDDSETASIDYAHGGIGITNGIRNNVAVDETPDIEYGQHNFFFWFKSNPLFL